MRRRIAYHAERKNMRIKIYDAETATVTSELYETLKLRQGTIRAASSEVLFVGLRNGKLVITGMEYTGRFY
jgi:methionyl-tRNA formyltransferase